jgi:hypothetical protein
MVRGHLVIHHDRQRMLLDTGSPVSVGRHSVCRFLGHEILLLQRYKGMTLDERSAQIGTPCDVLLGTDVLAHFAVQIDLEVGHVVFGEKLAESTPAAALQTVGGLPIVEIRVSGRTLRALLNTGATLSCLREGDTRTCRCVGVAREAYPGLGEFATELRRVPLTIGDQPVTLECGLLPSTLKQALRPLSVRGVLGTDLLKALRVGWGAGFSELHLAAPRQSAAHRASHPVSRLSLAQGVV